MKVGHHLQKRYCLSTGGEEEEVQMGRDKIERKTERQSVMERERETKIERERETVRVCDRDRKTQKRGSPGGGYNDV